MKTQVTLLAVCLLGAGAGKAQSTMSSPTSTTNTTTTYSTSPVATDTTNAGTATYSSTPTTTSDNSSNTNTNSTYSTNSAASPTYGTTTTTATDYTTQTMRDKKAKDYQKFVFGIYAGLNTTKFKGESVDNGVNSKLTGRLGYQAGFFVRGGGRLYGQIGAEYFASSSNYFVAGSGQTASNIKDQINIKYIQIPVYIGYKLLQSDRGISAIRLQVGLEYANQIGSDSNAFGSLNNLQLKTGTFNGLGQLGFDAGPIFLDFTYHYGFSNAITQNNGFAESQRRILSASVGFKF